VRAHHDEARSAAQGRVDDRLRRAAASTTSVVIGTPGTRAGAVVRVNAAAAS
jgi:hypothetical protein